MTEQDSQHLAKLGFVVEEVLKNLFGQRMGFALAVEVPHGEGWEPVTATNLVNDQVVVILQKALEYAEGTHKVKTYPLPVEMKDEKVQE